MIHKRLLIPCFLAFALGATVRAGEVNIDDLKPGLVAVYRDPASVEIVRLDPTVGFVWKTNESGHPRLSADGGSVAWDGFLNVLRPGEYRFSATVRGKLQVSIAGKEVLAAESKDKAATTQGQPVRLESGPQPVSIKFTRYPGPARLELLWQASYFRAEPLPYDALFHLPAKVPAGLATTSALERGRWLVEENNCIGCHKSDANDKLAKTLQGRMGPDLSQVGGRVTSAWMEHWLTDPQKISPTAAMPKLFAADEKAEIHAVAQYLGSLAPPAKPAPKPPNPKEMQTSVNNGQRLFASLGCITCHDSRLAVKTMQQPEVGVPLRRNFLLPEMGQKTEDYKLSAYLLDPLAVDPSGRMPNMLLDQKDATDLARFLCNKDNSKPLAALQIDGEAVTAFKKLKPTDADLATFAKLQPDPQWIMLGQKLVSERGCTNCHNIAPAKMPLPAHPSNITFDLLKSGKNATAGCLADDSAKRKQAPVFAVGEADRKTIRAFLTDGTKGAGSPSPTYAGRVALHRFNCFACHTRNGKGGLSSDIVEELRRYEKVENAEAVMPPPLTGVGHKLRTPWLKQVLTQKVRARPWMGLRMPHFGESVSPLVESLAYLEGTEPDDAIRHLPISGATIDAGKHLVGKNAFGCISCHDLAGIPNTGTRGPDLAYMNQRVRYDWYLRWLQDAQKMQPGTRMPTVFPDGKTTLPNLLDGSPEKQAEAMWAYLSLGPTLPLPAGLEPNIKGRILSVADRPVVLRCFVPDKDPESGARSIAVGYPGGVNVAWDANTCRLCYAWSGQFLDTAPIWDGRGGTPVKILGPRFWTGPPSHPWGLTPSNEPPPDYAAQAKDPAYGAAMPNDKIFHGVKQLQFLGYSEDAGGAPTFRYNVGDKDPLTVAERLEPLRSPVAVGVRRSFALHMPANKTPWLLAADSTGEPKLLDGKGQGIELDLKPGIAEIPVEDRLIVLPQGTDKITVLSAAAPKNSVWVLRKQGAVWQAMLRIPAAGKPDDAAVTVNVWAPYRADPTLLKELASTK